MIFNIYTLILIGLFCSTVDIEGKKGSSGTPSRGGILSRIKNTITGRNRNRVGMPQQPVRTNVGGYPRQSGGGMGYPRQGGIGGYPRSNTGLSAGAGALGGYGGYRWAKNAQRSSWGRSRNRGMLTGTLGALAGSYMGYKVGRAVGRYSHYHNGRNYWYGSRYYEPTMGRRTCIFELDESTPNWNVRYETDNSMVKEVIFECFSYEQCCELSCCRSPNHMTRNSSHPHRAWRWWHTFLLLSVLGIIFMACMFAAAKLFKSRRQPEMVTLGYEADESRKPFYEPNAYPPSYPAQYAPPGPNSYGYSQQPPPYPTATNYAPAY